MKSAMALFLLSLAVAGCRSPGSDVIPTTDWTPLATATSPCGRYTLRLEHSEWRTDPGEGTRLSLQMAMRTGEPDVFPCGVARVTDLVSADGVEFREAGLGGYSSVDGRSGTVSFVSLKVYEPGDSLRRLRVECPVMRVLSWRTYDLSCAGVGDSTEFLCPPFHVGLSGEETMCHVVAWSGEDGREAPPAQRDLFGLIGHDQVAEGAELHDATGMRMDPWGASGSGGHTVAHYGPPMSLEAGAEAPRPITYPVTGTLRLPHRYVVERVAFEFIDCPLSATPAAGAEPANGDGALEARLFPLSDEELFALGITSVTQAGETIWSIAWTEDRGPRFEAVDRVLRAHGIDGGAVCNLGHAGFYVPRAQFFRARRALLADGEVVRLGVHVVTPGVAPFVEESPVGPTPPASPSSGR